MKFDYIFDSVSANIVYASPSQQDLTEEILKELEKGLETTGK
jgi:Skp family chaperone for outer membrane proteins